MAGACLTICAWAAFGSPEGEAPDTDRVGCAKRQPQSELALLSDRIYILVSSSCALSN
jgi:hypothetical protein